MIKLVNVTKKIGKNIILNNINVEFKPGCIYGLRGNNGSGKTMLMRSIAGLMKPTEGQIYIGDKLLYNDMDFPDSIGILIENPSFIGNMRGLENLMLLASYFVDAPKDAAREAMEKVGLNPDDKRKYSKYSLGMKQKLGVAAAIMGNPDIILLDEPINAIDEEGVERVKDVLINLKKDKIIIVACHDREELDFLADKIYLIKEGHLYDEESYKVHRL